MEWKLTVGLNCPMWQVVEHSDHSQVTSSAATSLAFIAAKFRSAHSGHRQIGGALLAMTALTMPAPRQVKVAASRLAFVLNCSLGHLHPRCAQRIAGE